MKKMKRHTFFAGAFIWLTFSLTAQQVQYTGHLSGKSEDIVLVTDRSHYITGEVIHFNAFYQGSTSEETAGWSKILYVEFITPNGSSLAKMKVLLESTGGRGSMIIPTGISTGTYYLKAYTKWMRNCGPEAYSYISVQVYDPFNESVIPVDTSGQFMAGSGDSFDPPDRGTMESLECILDHTLFGQREKVDVGLKWTFPNTTARVCVSVSRAEMHGNQARFSSGCQITAVSEALYLPEIQGVSLTGQAISRSGREPAPYATIYVSVLGEDRNFFCNYSDSAGRFYFSFPDYVGERDLFVSTYHAEYEELELLIDRDFSSDALHLPSFSAALSDTLLEIVTELSINAQVAQQYYPSRLAETQQASNDERLFYGHPSATIRFDDFIKLPRLEEYFTEVIPQVSVRKTRGARRFVVQGDHPDLEIYRPLVMIDGVAIFDVDAVLAVSPRLIDRVEIVNAPYIRGNVTFGGIISILSRKNDLGYIDLPSSGLLVNYQMLDRPFKPANLSTPEDDRLPDVRNTLYWHSDLSLEPGKDTSFSFFTADVTGDYEILIRGYDSTGKFVSATVQFSVE